MNHTVDRPSFSAIFCFIFAKIAKIENKIAREQFHSVKSLRSTALAVAGDGCIQLSFRMCWEYGRMCVVTNQHTTISIVGRTM